MKAVKRRAMKRNYSSLTDLSHFISYSLPSVLTADNWCMMEGINSTASLPEADSMEGLDLSPKRARTVSADIDFLISTKQSLSRSSSDASTVRIGSPPPAPVPEPHSGHHKAHQQLVRTDDAQQNIFRFHPPHPLRHPVEGALSPCSPQCEVYIPDLRDAPESDDETNSTPDIEDVMAQNRLDEVTSQCRTVADSDGSEEPMDTECTDALGSMDLRTGRKLRVTFSPSTKGYDSFTGKYSKKNNSGAPRGKLTKKLKQRQATIKEVASRANSELGIKTSPTMKAKSIKEKHEKLAARLKRDPSKQLRESVPDSCFVLNSLDWTPWETVVVPEADPNDPVLWRLRRDSGAYPGLRRDSLFPGKCERIAIYEFAVQPKGTSEHYVTYLASSSGFSPRDWEQRLLRSLPLNQSINDVIKRGCSVCCRLANVTGETYVRNGDMEAYRMPAIKKLSLGQYDYAWNGQHKRDIFEWGAV